MVKVGAKLGICSTGDWGKRELWDHQLSVSTAGLETLVEKTKPDEFDGSSGWTFELPKKMQANSEEIAKKIQERSVRCKSFAGKRLRVQSTEQVGF